VVGSNHGGKLRCMEWLVVSLRLRLQKQPEFVLWVAALHQKRKGRHLILA
jgi:hypothetical protein